jgi:predicted metal-dependent hydrolase
MTTQVKDICAWGKYQNDTMTSNPQLIHASQTMLDYVIVRECIHAKIVNN